MPIWQSSTLKYRLSKSSWQIYANNDAGRFSGSIASIYTAELVRSGNLPSPSCPAEQMSEGRS
jgi:hypothetical protein